MSITHNKTLNPLLNLLIDCISAKYELFIISIFYAPQSLSVEGECTFLLLNFLVIGLCNYFTNFSLEIFSFLVLLPEIFLSKNS